jgi:AraC-like DNA-binding protein
VGVPADLLVHLRRARDHIDRHYQDPLDLDQLATLAGISKFHFQRTFKATYGISPAEYLSRRRLERAQDLLRATNLTVTEVCHTVGFSSLGSFSARFRALVGESPTAFQARFAVGAPHIPGCLLFMWGMTQAVDAESAAEGSASEEKPEPVSAS